MANPFDIPEATNYAPAFTFDSPGAALAGTVTGFSRAFSKSHDDGTGHPVMILSDCQARMSPKGKTVNVDGDRAVHVFHTALVSQLRKTDPKIGERVVIVRGEDTESKTGNTYQSFRVACPKRPPVTSFLAADGSIGPDPAQTQLPGLAEHDDDLPF